MLLGGSASFPGNAAAKHAFSRARSVYWSVHFCASWAFLNGIFFPLSPRLLACAVDRFCVWQSTGQSWRAKEPPCERKCLPLENKPSQTCGECQVGEPSGSLSFRCCERRFSWAEAHFALRICPEVLPGVHRHWKTRCTGMTGSYKLASYRHCLFMRCYGCLLSYYYFCQRSRPPQFTLDIARVHTTVTHTCRFIVAS